MLSVARVKDPQRAVQGQDAIHSPQIILYLMGSLLFVECFPILLLCPPQGLKTRYNYIYMYCVCLCRFLTTATGIAMEVHSNIVYYRLSHKGKWHSLKKTKEQYGKWDQ